MRRTLAHCTLLGLAGLPVVHAAEAPSAGQATQELRVPVQPPRPTQPIDLQSPAGTAVAPGGQQVQIRQVSFTGNRHFDAAQLQAVLGDVAGQSHDLAGMRALAARVQSHYRAAGFPFARVLVPAQAMEQGQLRLQVIEGRYGKVDTSGDAWMAPRARAFIAALAPGEDIRSDPVERAALILGDLPGVRVTPIVRPGQELGTGDLDVRVDRDSRWAGDVGLDNHGNRYTGRYRAKANFFGNSNLLLGDQASLRLLYTNENMWFGSLGYAAPIGASGLRGNASYARTSYQLGGEFASLDAFGTADVVTTGLSYPFVRTQNANLTGFANHVHKRLNDRRNAVGSNDTKHSSAVPFGFNFDWRDNVLGAAAITYGAFTVTHGRLDLSEPLASTDAATARSRGAFYKSNLDIGRIQSLPAGFTLYARASAQWSGDNLDASEKFGLGGIHGVRAYPGGEGFGDEGWLRQLELRYAMGAFSPYVFHDEGRVRTTHTQWTPGANDRGVAGAGAGVRYLNGPVQVDVLAAWRTWGGAPQSDSKDQRPVVWFSLTWRF